MHLGHCGPTRRMLACLYLSSIECSKLTGMNESTLGNLLSQLADSAGATEADLKAAEQGIGMSIPSAYRRILAKHDGGEIKVGSRELTIWTASYILQAHSEFEVGSALPGALLFCSDENGDAYGFDLRAGSAGGVVKVDMIGMNWDDAVVVGDSFEDLLSRLS